LGFRAIYSSFRQQLLQELTSTYYLIFGLLEPIVFTFVFSLMFQWGGAENYIPYIAVASGIMGMWSVTVFVSGGNIEWERFLGTLELLMATPTSFIEIMFGKILANSALTIESIGVSLLSAYFFFQKQINVAYPMLFIIVILASVVSLSILGLVLVSAFTVSRSTWALANMLEYPVWILTGVMFPISQLPSWILPFSYILSPTWCAEALKMSVFGGDVSNVLFDLLIVGILTFFYYLLAKILFILIEHYVKKTGALQLG